MEFASLLGVVIAMVAILGGFLLEGGHLAAVTQPTAALIVFGGTLGALFLQFPMSALKAAARGFVSVFIPPPDTREQVLEEIVGYAQSARRGGILALEAEAEQAEDPMLKKALQMAIDGTESPALREAMEIELDAADEAGIVASKVFEAGGGYAPTIGILGAVLGLIHVMQNLSEPDKLGAGIAVAFVATVYAVALANLFLLPIAGKLKQQHALSQVRGEIIITGIAAIVDGENPRLIEQKLYGFIEGSSGSET